MPPTSARLGAATLACLLFTCVGVNAQTTLDTTSPTGKQPTQNPTEPPPAPGQSVTNPAPPAAPPRSTLDSIADIGQTLKSNGLYFSLGYVEDILANVAGGRETGTLPTGELFFGTVLDLETIAGLRGSSFHITFDERNGYSINNFVGTQGPLQANSGPSRSTRLSEFYWQQGFYDDKVDITVGRTNPTADFATSAISCNWVSSVICAQPGSWYFSNNNQAYPASTWGGRINIAPAPNFYMRGGLYEDNTRQFLATQHGFDWSTHHSEGVFVPVEFGYATTFTGTRYPEKYDIGAYYDAARYTTPGGQLQHDRTALWAQFQKTVFRPDPSTTQSLDVLGGVIWYQGGAPYWSQVYGGFVDRAPFGPVRANDTVNFIASYYANNSAFTPAHSNQWIFELNYGFTAWPGIILKPVTQYIYHPNEIGFVPQKRPTDAWVVGVQLSLDAAAALKFPQFVPH
jgi:carbohydrate-selective porin OprB